MNPIPAGGTASFSAVLELNGAPATTQPTFTWSTNLSDALISPSADTTTATLTIAATETATSVTVTATAVDPTGATQSGSDTEQITPAQAQVFTVSVTRTA